MSKIHQTLIIEPSNYSNAEEYTFTGFTCPHCQGRKGWWHQGAHDDEWVACTKCENTGKLKAEVKINWKAEK